VFSERGIKLHQRSSSVELVPGTMKKADLSFDVRGMRWVFEVKSGLEFNSLGAAVLEGILFRHRDPNCRFVILSLYSKMRTSPDRLRELLAELRLSHAFDHIIVLSLNNDPDEVWRENMAKRVNDFFGLVPMPEEGGTG
jgi:hypothetical protein